MSEERLQEIKDSISLQYKVQEANDLNNFNIFTDEEQELVEEIERLRAELKLEEDNRKYLNEQIERLHSIIKEVREYIENNDLYEQDYDYDYEENLVVGPPSDETARKILLEILDKENK